VTPSVAAPGVTHPSDATESISQQTWSANESVLREVHHTVSSSSSSSSAAAAAVRVRASIHASIIVDTDW